MTIININKDRILRFINIHQRKVIVLSVILVHILILSLITLNPGKKQRRKGELLVR